jgi:hypothetical protein
MKSPKAGKQKTITSAGNSRVENPIKRAKSVDFEIKSTDAKPEDFRKTTNITKAQLGVKKSSRNKKSLFKPQNKSHIIQPKHQ